MQSYLSQEEIDGLQASNLSRATPFVIRGVIQTQFSIARYYGAAKFNGDSYTYLGDSDELIRDDVLKWLMKRRQPKKPQRAQTPTMKQKTLTVT